MQYSLQFRGTCPPCGEILGGNSEDAVLEKMLEHASKFHDLYLPSVVSLEELRAAIRRETELYRRLVEHLMSVTDGYAKPVRSVLEAELCEREREIVQYIAHGFSNRAIAKRLCISDRTVSTHLVNIYQKLGVHSRAGLVALVRACDRVIEAGMRSFYTGHEPFRPA